MKILHILNELRPSGAEIMLHLAGPIWSAMGFNLEIISLSNQPGPYTESLESAGWTVTVVSRSGSKWQTLRKVREVLKRQAPDLVHIHTEGMNLGLATVAYSLGIPAARTVHSMFLFTGSLHLRKGLERRLCRAMDVCQIAISDSVLQNELTRFNNPTKLLWNWFDTEGFRPPSTREREDARRRLGLPLDRKVLVSVGNGSDVKNYKAIIAALGVLRDERLLYCQVGNPHPKGIDAAVANNLQLDKQVRWVGPRTDILDWLWASDLFLMPSIFEGFGLAAAEALAAGCTCVFSDCPGLIDFKQFGVEAQWLPPDSELLSHAIRSLLATPFTNTSLIKNYEIVTSSFTPEIRAKAYGVTWAGLQ